ncbi:hypothetical protein [Spirillospora sp. NPDC029432]|uniref:hypothetical protein n=1 Tax=Spirillospora sp. NPDC029432 TaxID=3154599 RepID=UPI00345603B7
MGEAKRQRDGGKKDARPEDLPSTEYAAEMHDLSSGRRSAPDGAAAKAKKYEEPIYKELHVCQGLGACKGFDIDGAAYMAGTGNCATVRHVCHGEGQCRGQGGCGYAGDDAQQFRPGEHDCRFNGSCASPINVSRVFCAGPLKGKSVWKQARRQMEARMYRAGLAFGPSPGEGIPDDLIPRYDLRDVDPDAIKDPPLPEGPRTSDPVPMPPRQGPARRTGK